MGLVVISLFDGCSGGLQALIEEGFIIDEYYASEIDKPAMSVALYNHQPLITHIGDVTKVRYEDGILYTERGNFNVPNVDMVIGGSPCFAAGTKVLTAEGYRNIEDIKIGDKVLTHSGTYQKVLRIGGDYKTIYELKAQGVFRTKTTSEHPYLVKTRNRVWNNERRSYDVVFSEPVWKKVSEIEKGAYLAIPKIKVEENSLGLSLDECRVLGRYIADGHTRKDMRTTEGRPNDRHWQLIISCGKYKDVETGIKHGRYPHTKSVDRVVFSSKRLVELAEKHCGVGAFNKKISPTLLNLPKEHLESLITGVLDGDGCVTDKGVWKVTTISQELVMSLSLAIAKVYNVCTNIEHTKRPEKRIIEGREVNQKDTFTAYFCKERRPQSKFYVCENYIWVPFKSLEITDKQRVYNLEVEKDNTYTANNVVVHNCQGFSFAGKQLNFEDPRSKLFFEYVRIVDETLPRYFFLENVRMKKEFQQVISDHLGVEPVMLNSALVSAQNRVRLYWTNIPGYEEPKDEGILLKHIVLENTEQKVKLTERNLRHFRGDNEKSLCCTATMYKGAGNNGTTLVFEETDRYDILMDVPEATKKGFTSVKVGDGVDLTFLNSKTRRGRKMADKSNCLTATNYEYNLVEELRKYIVPFDKTLQILEKEVEKGKVGYFRKDSQANRVYFIHGKAVTLCGDAGGGAAKMGQYGFYLNIENMYGYIYITENLINGKKYIGKCKSSFFNPNYLGSGKALKDSLKKYNKEDYEVTMLEACESESSLNEAEERIIKEHNAVASDDYYNLKDGGENGFQGGKHSEETKAAMREINKGSNNPFYGKTHSEETKKKIGDMERGEKNHNYGGLSKEHSEKISKALKGKAKSQSHIEALKGRREILTCPHCGLMGGNSNMKRYHFDNCKNKYLFGCITPDRIEKRQNGQRFSQGDKFYTLTAQDKHVILIEGYIRKLTPVECERLQTLPDGYTEKGVVNGTIVPISDTQRYKMLGNGWTTKAIRQFFKHIDSERY